MKAYLALIKIDLKLALRARSVVVFSYVFPLIFFFIFAQAFHAEQGGAILQVVAMVATIGILGNGLFGAGMRAVQERENNVLRRYKVTPVSPTPLLVASMVTGLFVYLPYVALMLFLANRIYHMPVPENLLSVFVFVTIGLVAFRAIGLIIAAVVNSMQESMLLVQLTYFAMLFLSGASFPTSIFPLWMQKISQFLPATYLVSGLQGILLRKESIWHNAPAVGALLLTAVVATLVASKLFRWEKEEKIRPAAKLWVLAALFPFLVLGAWQFKSNDNLTKTKVLERDLRRSRALLIRNARIFVGDGKVMESGAILVRNGKIAELYDGAGPDPKSLNAEPVEAAGKTVLPGLIDVHVHLGSSGGIEDPPAIPSTKTLARELAAYLYSGVTAVKSAGDPLELVLQTRALVNGGERLGAELFAVGPLFTAAKGHPTEIASRIPEQFRAQFLATFVRTPKTAQEAREEVDALKKAGVDGIKGVLEAGVAGTLFTRMDVDLLRAAVAEAAADHLPSVIHTGDGRDVADAVSTGATGIEHGSFRDRIPAAVFAQMAARHVFYDPTLSVIEGANQFSSGKTDLLSRSLLQQVAAPALLKSTRAYLQHPRQSGYPMSMEIGKQNLLDAWRAGVPLATGSDAGNPLVFHGPTVQRELELWVEAGIPPAVALQAATSGAAKLLNAGDRIGSIRRGMEATMVIVDGNPMQDIRATGSITSVLFKGERVQRSELFDQE